MVCPVGNDKRRSYRTGNAVTEKACIVYSIKKELYPLNLKDFNAFLTLNSFK